MATKDTENEPGADEQGKKPLKLARPGKLELKKTIDGGQVRQSFSHGRSKTVQVEVKKKRVFVPGQGHAPDVAPSSGTPSVERPSAPTRPSPSSSGASAKPAVLRVLTEEERARLREQLSSILGYMEILDELDTSAILPTAQVIETSTVMRLDEPRASLDRSLALLNAPDAEDGCFKVDAVLENE